MSDTSLLTIVRGRRAHLHNLLRGIANQTSKPREVIIVFMNEAVPDELPDPGCELRLDSLRDEQYPLPLAAARNRAAALARGEVLCFLDVDCIPHGRYLEHLTHAVCLTKGLVMGDVRYLPEEATAGNWTDSSLDRLARPHPRRPKLPADHALMTLPYHLFWSLSFGLHASDFARLGGFDEHYRGYGGEDTDFAFTARKLRLPLYGCGARVYHQYHPSYTPPYNHLQDIVVNANRFYEKWQIWPMSGWLKQFEAEGYIDWRDKKLTLLKLPDQSTIAGAISEDPFA